ncbi:MAG: HAD-IB family phosphatase [Candidatus Promineofilum sp.]|nr:HAD-IB family phosphatase [Promineifilum sp.]
MRWPPFEHIFFDCDSTLTTVEGIDILAEKMGKRQGVEMLTQAAMDGTIELEDIYKKRLDTLNPTRQQVLDLRHDYKRNMVEDAARVVAALQALGHKVYIISGGLAEPVEEFGISLGIPRDRIRAVELAYNELSGQWWDKSDTDSKHYLKHAEGALTVSNGKAQIVRELLGDQLGRSLLIGDGQSDLVAGHSVDLFVGYGGVVARSNVKAEAPAFINSPSLAPLLGLAGGPAELRILSTWPMPYQSLSLKAQYLIHKGVVTFNDEHLESKFRRAFFAAQ